MAPFGKGSYANTDGCDSEERAAAIYGGHLPRLRSAKAGADPKGLLPCPYMERQSKIQEVDEGGTPRGGAAVEPGAFRAFYVEKKTPKLPM